MLKKSSIKQMTADYKKSLAEYLQDFEKKLAATYSPALAVPSALEGLTSVFGMGTGEPLC